MRGAAWVASYFLLCLTVLSLAACMLLLYRRLQPETLDRRKIGRWPSPLFGPGDAPASLRLNFDAAGLQGRLIVVVARRKDDLLFAAVSAARDVARRYGLRCVLVTTTGHATDPRVLPPSFETVRVFSLAEGDFERLGLIATPATILWDDGAVDAALGFLSPQQVERRFASFLRPQAVLMPDAVPQTGAHAPLARTGLALLPPERPAPARPSSDLLVELLADREGQQNVERPTSPGGVQTPGGTESPRRMQWGR